MGFSKGGGGSRGSGGKGKSGKAGKGGGKGKGGGLGSIMGGLPLIGGLFGGGGGYPGMMGGYPGMMGSSFGNMFGMPMRSGMAPFPPWAYPGMGYGNQFPGQYPGMPGFQGPMQDRPGQPGQQPPPPGQPPPGGHFLGGGMPGGGGGGGFSKGDIEPNRNRGGQRQPANPYPPPPPPPPPPAPGAVAPVLHSRLPTGGGGATGFAMPQGQTRNADFGLSGDISQRRFGGSSGTPLAGGQRGPFSWYDPRVNS